MIYIISNGPSWSGTGKASLMDAISSSAKLQPTLLLFSLRWSGWDVFGIVNMLVGWTRVKKLRTTCLGVFSWRFAISTAVAVYYYFVKKRKINCHCDQTVSIPSHLFLALRSIGLCFFLCRDSPSGALTYLNSFFFHLLWRYNHQNVNYIAFINIIRICYKIYYNISTNRYN